MQRELLLRINKRETDISEVLRCSTFLDALALCKSKSGLTDKQILMELDIDAGQWSRIWSGQAHFPTVKIERFMEICGNIVPIQYLTEKYGFEMRPKKSRLELELEREREEKEELKRKLDIITEWENQKK